MADVTWELQDLHFSHGREPVLRGMNLAFEPGHLYGVIGPNGSGKSTLLNLMAGHLKPSGGSVLLNGIPVHTLPPAVLAPLAAMVPQSGRFTFPFTVSEAALMGRHPHIPRFSRPSEHDLGAVRAALEIMDMAHLAHRSLDELSGGERQRCMVARCLAQATPGLLLDEPTSSMDIRHGLAAMAELVRLVRDENRTVIAVLHDLNLAAAHCDRIVMLDRGTVHATGDVAEILTPAAIREVFGVAAQTIPHPGSNRPVITFTQEP